MHPEVKGVKTILTDCQLFSPTSRILCFGGSCSGKSFFLQNLVLKHHKKFKQIILCGAKNILLTHPSTKDKTVHHTCRQNPIWDPFSNIDESEINLDKRGILIFIDDLMTESCQSLLVSDIFSKGRHLNISVILVLQSYFPQSTARSLMPQIKNNSCVQILFKLRNKSETSIIGKKIESTKAGQSFFKNLIDREVYSKKFGYIAMFLDETCEETMYRNNLVKEDKTNCETVFCKVNI